MKQGIHPNWNNDCVVTCSCGNTFVTGSASKTMQVDICNACHPFFTGEMRFVDRQGRVDKFLKKMKMATDKRAVAAQKATAKAAKKTSKTDQEQKSYKQILVEQQKELKNQNQEPAPQA